MIATGSSTTCTVVDEASNTAVAQNQQGLTVDEVDLELGAACVLGTALESFYALLENPHQIEQLAFCEVVQTLHVVLAALGWETASQRYVPSPSVCGLQAGQNLILIGC